MQVACVHFVSLSLVFVLYTCHSAFVDLVYWPPWEAAALGRPSTWHQPSVRARRQRELPYVLPHIESFGMAERAAFIRTRSHSDLSSCLSGTCWAMEQITAWPKV